MKKSEKKTTKILLKSIRTNVQQTRIKQPKKKQQQTYTPAVVTSHITVTNGGAVVVL